VNSQEVAILLRVLRAEWPNTPIGADKVQAWQWALEGIAFSHGERAVKAWLRVGKPYFPHPSELLEIVSNDELGADETAEAAWVEVQREIRRVGFNRPPTFMGGRFLEPPQRRFSSVLIAQAVDSVGWDVLCTTDDTAQIRDQFLWTYKALRKRDLLSYQRGNLDASTALPDGNAPKELAG